VSRSGVVTFLSTEVVEIAHEYPDDVWAFELDAVADLTADVLAQSTSVRHSVGHRVGGITDDIDDHAVLDLLDALVRKSLLVADRRAGRTRFSIIETIRQFAEDELVGSGAAEQVRAERATTSLVEEPTQAPCCT
jgi:predicted ATPase